MQRVASREVLKKAINKTLKARIFEICYELIKRIKIIFLESLILAQDERWRRA